MAETNINPALIGVEHGLGLPSKSHVDLLKTVIDAKLSDSEASNLGILFRRVIDGDISVSDLRNFALIVDVPTREEAFAAMASYKPEKGVCYV